MAAQEMTARESIDDNSWGKHMRATLVLGLPLVGAQLAQMGIHTTDILIVARLGTLPLAAMVLAGQYFFIILICGFGIAAAVVPMVTHAYSTGDIVGVRRAVRMGLWAVILYSILVMPLFLYSKEVLVMAGQDPGVAELATIYLNVVGWGIFPGLGFMVLRSPLSATTRASFILYVTLGSLFLNAILAYGLVLGHFGLPALGIFGAAIVALAIHLLGFIATVIYIERIPELRQYELFVRFWRPDWRMFGEVVKLGLPISLMLLAESGLFAAASLLVGWIGTSELAAHGIALQLASIAFMVPLGLSQAATVRVGIASGRNDHLALMRASWAVLFLATGCTVIGGLVYALAPAWCANLFLDQSKGDAAEVLAIATGLVVVAGIFQLVDGLQVVAAGLLRGIKDTSVPMLIALFSYWPFGFTLAYILAFPAGYGIIGIWFGLLSGLGMAAGLLLWRYWLLTRRMGIALPA